MKKREQYAPGVDYAGNVPTARKPHRDWAGYVTERRNPWSGGHVVIVRAREAGLDESGGSWVTVCNEHSTLCNHRNRALAYSHLTAPEGWCEVCAEIAAKAKGLTTHV